MIYCTASLSSALNEALSESSVQDAQAMFDSSMTAAAIAEKVADLQKAAGISSQLVNPYGRGTSFITLSGWVALAALAALFIVIAGKPSRIYHCHLRPSRNLCPLEVALLWVQGKGGTSTF